MKAWFFHILAPIALMLSGSTALAQMASDFQERYYPDRYYPEYSYRSFTYRYPMFAVPDANLIVPNAPLTSGEKRALNSRVAHDGDITTNPGVKARIDRDITTQPGRKDPFDRDITKRRDR